MAGNRNYVGNLTDFAEGVTKDDPLFVQISTNDKGKVVFFYDKPLTEAIVNFEYHAADNRLIVVMQSEERRDSGLTLRPEIKKHMHNTHQILTILMDNKTGEAERGEFKPLLLH